MGSACLPGRNKRPLLLLGMQTRRTCRGATGDWQRGRRHPSCPARTMNSGVPTTLMACCCTVASPRSPILTAPVAPLMKRLSHLRSRCTMGGVWP